MATNNVKLQDLIAVSVVGRQRTSEKELLRGKNDARKDLVNISRYSESVVKSQQTCTIRENRNKLENLLSQSANQSDTFRLQASNRINGLLSVWDMLTADGIGTNGKEYTSCFVTFNDALEVYYNSFQEVIEPPYINTEKDKFLYAVVHKQWGLCVYIVTHEYKNERMIVLRPDGVDMELFLDNICQKCEDNFMTCRIDLDMGFVRSLLASMDSEWDKVVARVLIGLDRSRKQLEALGIHGRDMSKNVEKVSYNHFAF